MEDFDLIQSFAVDYMHCVCLNIMSNLQDFWLNPKYKNKSFYLKPKQKKILNSRIKSVKMWSSFSRRIYHFIPNWSYKASEYRSMLLFCLPVCLRGVLPNKYLEHFNLLSHAIHILLRTSITSQELRIAKDKLLEFVKKFQVYYGRSKMTMNVHLLSHLPECVIALGPLWAYSMFALESNNGILGRFHKANRDLVAELGYRYLLRNAWFNDFSSNRQNDDPATVLLSKKTIKLSATEQSAIFEYGIDDCSEFDIYERFKNNHETIFTSVHYTKARKTIDYVISTIDEQMGAIQFFFKKFGSMFAVIQELVTVQIKDHIIEVCSSEEMTVMPVDKIDKKLIYIEYNKKKFVTSLPNDYEKD